jgi:phosphatidylserine/phosphatidylglycerophosphate/cardiolipin synthase-like enzyme
VIVDGERVLISSINWNKHSPTYNREIGIIIENPELAAYYTEVFLWQNRGRIIKNDYKSLNSGSDDTARCINDLFNKAMGG